jgi:hypothetical protein
MAVAQSGAHGGDDAGSHAGGSVPVQLKAPPAPPLTGTSAQYVGQHSPPRVAGCCPGGHAGAAGQATGPHGSHEKQQAPGGVTSR